MRMQRIAPSLFGRFTTTRPLTLPEGAMVVVFGENETGKSTYADLAVTLLSDKYETNITDRYGERGAPLRGEIDLVEDNATLTIQFEADATVPGNRSAVKRESSNRRSPLWRKISSLDSAIVRTLFRLNAAEIQNGDEAKKKFKNYGLGDRRGASIAAVLQRYSQAVAASTRQINEGQSRLADLRSELIDAEQTGSQHQNILVQIERAKVNQSRIEDDLAEINRELEALLVCSMLDPVIEGARHAESNLQAARENGEFVPEAFGSVVTSLGELIEELSLINLAGLNSEVWSKKNDLEGRISTTDEELRGLGLDQTSLLANITLAEQHNRNHFLADIQGKIQERNGLAETLVTLRDQDNSLEVDAAQRRVNAANDAWGKTGISISAYEYIARPETLNSPTLGPSSAGPRRKALMLAAVVAVGSITTAAAGQLVGAAGILFVGLVSAVLFGMPLTRGAGVESSIKGPVDAGTLKTIASEVVNSERALSDAVNNLKGVRESVPIKTSRLQELETQIEQLLSAVGLAIKGTVSPAGLNGLFETIAGLVSESRAITVLTQDLVDARKALEFAQGDFDSLKVKIVSAFSDAGIEISPERISNPNDAIKIIEDWHGRWNEQVGWRRTVSDVEEQINSQPHLTSLVRDLLTKSPDERGAILEISADHKRTLLRDREGLSGDISDWEREARDLADESRIAKLKAEILAVTGEIDEHRIEVMRLQVQIALVDTLARKRAEEAKPELVRRVQDMVLAVAEDWAAIEFDESGDVIYVERRTGEKVRDSALSAGARSLLFTAMRVAIMQQESDGENGFSIPLFCDDPLLHLDDKRTRQAMRMLRDQAHGHQIIYFTCKNDIRELAYELEIPVINVG